MPNKNEHFDPEVEKLYQMFKKRLMEELFVLSPHLPTLANLVDKSDYLKPMPGGKDRG
ncbi:MAG: hypothetical protein WC848_02590 [Parcubacteria group bacterium]|jgi:hypothetical protein